jgi:S-adenosylmethionine:tRNA ribosyltransferase-isomerase
VPRSQACGRGGRRELGDVDGSPPVSGAERIDPDDYDFELPLGCIAQAPAPRREDARLMHLVGGGAGPTHHRVHDLPSLLRPGDLLVVNATRVLPARLRGRKASGGAVEALILGRADDAPGCYRALLKSNGRQRPGLGLRFESDVGVREATLRRVAEDGEVVLDFGDRGSPYDVGETPLPPYIERGAARTEDAERYQTTYARVPGAVAAPTAGLHLSESLLAALASRDIARVEVVLHVGPGTFRPPSPEDLARGRLHAERFELSETAAAEIETARSEGRRIVAVGTTSLRVLETCTDGDGPIRSRSGETDLFLRPGSRIRCADVLLTNFHLPRSSLLMLVAAFSGRERILAAYAEAVAEGYRFYSYGDAMLLER